MTDDTDKKAAAPAKVASAAAKPKPETDGERFTRHAVELAALLDEHRARVTKAHVDLPTPPKKFGKMTKDERRRWNAKRKIVSDSNRSYHAAVRAAVARHVAEGAGRSPPLEFRYDPRQRRAAR